MLRSEKTILLGAILGSASIAAALLFGFAGFRTIIGIILISLPFYLFFGSFGLSSDEKIVFSFFTAISIFPSMAYWLGFVVPFRLSVALVFVLLMIGHFALRKFRKKPIPLS